MQEHAHETLNLGDLREQTQLKALRFPSRMSHGDDLLGQMASHHALDARHKQTHAAQTLGFQPLEYLSHPFFVSKRRKCIEHQGEAEIRLSSEEQLLVRALQLGTGQVVVAALTSMLEMLHRAV